MSRLVRLPLIVLVFALFPQPPARACSCLRIDDGFLVPPGTELPANARGVPWSGWLDCVGQIVLVPGKDLFTFERIDGEKPEAVAFDLELLDGELLRPSDVLALIVPREGFEPGARYRVTYRPRYPRNEKTVRQLGARYRLEVSVGREPWIADGTDQDTAQLTIWKTLRDDLRAETRAGSCWVTVDAAQTGVELELPDDLARWREALLYVTRVDGEIYRPTSNLCAQQPPGHSWMGRARQLLFTVCSRSRSRASAEGDLPEGVHEVEMIAWLPGSGQSFRARRDVRLSCEGRDDRRHRDAYREPVWDLDGNSRLPFLEEADLMLADGTHLVVALYGTESPTPSSRLIVWKEGPEEILSRLHVVNSAQLDFDVLLRHDELFLATRATRPRFEGPEWVPRAAMVLHHVQARQLVPVEVDRAGRFGEDLPALRLDWKGWATPGYQDSSDGISFELESEKYGYIAGKAEIVPREAGFVLTANCCR